MSRLAILVACCALLGASVAGAREPVHARLQTREDTLFVDSITWFDQGGGLGTVTTPEFGGPPDTEDTFDLGLTVGQSLDMTIVYWKRNGAVQAPYSIPGVQEETWYVFPTDDPARIMYTRFPTGVAEPHGAALPRFSAAPNPFRGGTTIRGEVPLAGRLAGTVFDPAGRVVRRLESADAALSWDGRDDQGRRLDAGVYLVRVLAGDRSALVRLVLAD